MPTLVGVGGKSSRRFHDAMHALADALPDARVEVIDGQNHMIKPNALAPVLKEFFAGVYAESHA